METFGVAGDDLKTLQQIKADKHLIRFGLCKCKFTISKKQVSEVELCPSTPTAIGKSAEDGKSIANVPATGTPRRVKETPRG